MAERTHPSDDRFGAKYRIEARLGQGGMGEVLAATHVGLDEPVAIKVMHPVMLEVPGMVERFAREARIVAKLRSEHVVRVRDVDALPSGVPFMVMERLHGADLATLCKDRPRLGVAEAVTIVREACEGLAEAHRKGIVHRDIKPANLFVARRPDGSTVVKVLDFGVAMLVDAEGHNNPRLSCDGETVGSPSYMSPEQMESCRDVDARTDLWGLGAILYRVLTGVPPFRAEGLYQLRNQLRDKDPVRPTVLRPDIPGALEDVILRCLEKDRRKRFGSAAELAQALRPFEEPAVPRPSVELETLRPSVLSTGAVEEDTTAVTTFPTWARPRRRTPLVAIAAVAAFVAGGLFLLVRSPDPTATGSAPPAAPEATPVITATAAPELTASASASASAPLPAKAPPARTPMLPR